MMALMIKNTALCLALMIGISVLSTCSQPAYALPTGPHGQSGLVASDHLAHIPRLNAVFLCVPFGYGPFTVWLNGDTFACASLLSDLSTNPIQSNHPHLVVSGSTSNNLGVTTHANTAAARG